MNFYVLLLFAFLCSCQAKSISKLSTENKNLNVNHLDYASKTYEEKVDEIVNKLASCVNSTLKDPDFENDFDDLTDEDKEFLQNAGVSGLRQYVEFMFLLYNKEFLNPREYGHSNEVESLKEDDSDSPEIDYFEHKYVFENETSLENFDDSSSDTEEDEEKQEENSDNLRHSAEVERFHEEDFVTEPMESYENDEEVIEKEENSEENMGNKSDTDVLKSESKEYSDEPTDGAADSMESEDLFTLI